MAKSSLFLTSLGKEAGGGGFNLDDGDDDGMGLIGVMVVLVKPLAVA
jgi:hypothetical protein